MQNLSKAHEKNVQTAVQGEQVSNILDNVENVPYALRGSTVKSILYWLFCTIAALELSAALFFYVASLGTPQAVAAVMAGVIGFALHGLLHALLTDTTKGMVFSKKRESKAMSQEVKVNILLSIVLLITVALIVFFVGKKGFTAYRGHQYEIAQAEATGKAGPDKPLGITADMLVNKKGKISSDKLEQLAAVTTATAKAADSKTASVTADRQAYDSTTAQMTDIVGASAFVLELLLALLAYSIATAKYAAVFDEIARRNGSPQQAQQSTANNSTANNASSVTPQAANNTGKEFSFNNQIEFIKLNIVGYYLATQKALTVVDTVVLRQAFEQVNPTITDMGNNCFQFDEAPILTAYKALIEPPTTTPTTRKAIGFSDNKATNTGNEGRVIIKGFQRENKEKQKVSEVVTICRDDISSNDPKPETSNDISSDIPEGFAVCPMCDELFEKKNYRHTFCNEKCRVANWEATNGKKLRRVKA